MVYVLGEEVDVEIKAALREESVSVESNEEDIKRKFKIHKKLLIRHLNRKWDVSFLESSMDQKIIPRGLRDQVIPAKHLHNYIFLSKWKECCIHTALN